MSSALVKKGRLFFIHVASMTHLSIQTLYWTFIAPFYRKAWSYNEVAFQMNRVGVRSFAIVALISFLLGVILFLQSAHVAEPYGQLDAVPGAVGVSLAREIAPLMVAIVITGRVGAAYAAELGAQKVSDEITALQCMAIHPVGFLISPRFLALMVMLPVLTVYGNVMGLAGGYAIAVTKYQLAGPIYLESTFDFVQMNDIVNGLLKSLVFAFIICMVGCYKGFTVTGGSSGVGRATMQAVVLSLVLIIAGDAVFTALTITYM